MNVIVICADCSKGFPPSKMTEVARKKRGRSWSQIVSICKGCAGKKPKRNEKSQKQRRSA